MIMANVASYRSAYLLFLRFFVVEPYGEIGKVGLNLPQPPFESSRCKR